MTKIAIVGSRDYKSVQRVIDYVNSLPDDYIVVSGGARGVDSLAEEVAKNRGLQTRIFEADWNKYGKSAGKIRNNDIVNDSDAVVAFWNGKSTGTLDTIQKAVCAGKMVKIYPDCEMKS